MVNEHTYYSVTEFAENVKEGQGELPALYCSPNLHKRPYKARFIANSSSCTTTELSELLTSCLTAIRKYVIKIATRSMEDRVRFCFGPLKIRMKF